MPQVGSQPQAGWQAEAAARRAFKAAKRSRRVTRFDPQQLGSRPQLGSIPQLGSQAPQGAATSKPQLGSGAQQLERRFRRAEAFIACSRWNRPTRGLPPQHATSAPQLGAQATSMPQLGSRPQLGSAAQPQSLLARWPNRPAEAGVAATIQTATAENRTGAKKRIMGSCLRLTNGNGWLGAGDYPLGDHSKTLGIDLRTEICIGGQRSLGRVRRR
jgi:hypothetical protein